MSGEAIRHHVKNMYRLYDTIVQRFRPIVKFDIGLHHIYIQPRQQDQRQRLPTKFIMTKEEIQEIINEWSKEWCVLVREDQLRQEENQVQEDESDEANKEEDPPDDLESAESYSPSIPTHPNSEDEGGATSKRTGTIEKK